MTIELNNFKIEFSAQAQPGGLFQEWTPEECEQYLTTVLANMVYAQYRQYRSEHHDGLAADYHEDWEGICAALDKGGI